MSDGTDVCTHFDIMCGSEVELVRVLLRMSSSYVRDSISTLSTLAALQSSLRSSTQHRPCKSSLVWHTRVRPLWWSSLQVDWVRVEWGEYQGLAEGGRPQSRTLTTIVATSPSLPGYALSGDIPHLQPINQSMYTPDALRPTNVST